MTNTETYADKIAKLLRKAESTTPEEAEALVAKAQQLMTQFEIDEEMLAKARGQQRQEQLTKGTMQFAGIFQTVTMNIGFATARANNCRAHYRKMDRVRPKRHDVWIFGYESDVRNAEMLASSIEIQCIGAMRAWERTPECRELFETASKMDKYKDRREFIVSFTNAVTNRLYVAKREGEKAAAAAEAKRSNVSKDVASSSVALVLRSKEEKVKDWYDELHPPSSLKKSSRNYHSGTGSARSAGRAAGDKADLGGTKIGQRGRLGGGS